MPQEDVCIIANDDSPANEQTPLLNGSSSLLIPRNFTDPTTPSTLTDDIGSDFESSNRVSWIAVSYILSNTAFQPLYGRLSDIFGRKPCLIFANVVFLIGTLGCAI